MGADQIESLYDDVNDALTRRMAGIGENTSPRELTKLLAQIRAMKLVAQQLVEVGAGTPHQQVLIDALRSIKGELDR